VAAKASRLRPPEELFVNLPACTRLANLSCREMRLLLLGVADMQHTPGIPLHLNGFMGCAAQDVILT